MAVKSLDAMVRLNRWKVDEQSRALSKLQDEVLVFDREEQRLMRELAEEKAIASASLEASAHFAVYAQRLLKRREAIAELRGKLEVRIAEARDKLREAMGEAKKFEIAEAARVAREDAAEQAQESNRLDEVALNGFRRKEE